MPFSSPRETVTLRIPPGTSSGAKLRVKGHGVAPKNGPPGDLLAEIQIVLPKQLNDADREAIQQIVALHDQENTTIGEQARLSALDELYGLGYDYRKTFDARIKAVKLKDVVEVAQKYFGNHVLVTSSPEKKD